MEFSLCNTKVLYAGSEILVYPKEESNLKLINAKRLMKKSKLSTLYVKGT